MNEHFAVEFGFLCDVHRVCAGGGRQPIGLDGYIVMIEETGRSGVSDFQDIRDTEMCHEGFCGFFSSGHHQAAMG